MQELRGTDAYLVFPTSVSKTLKKFLHRSRNKKMGVPNRRETPYESKYGRDKRMRNLRAKVHY